MNFIQKAFLASLSTIALLSQSTVIGNDLNSFNIPLNEFKAFPSDWSLAPEEVFLALKYATYEDTFQILEFGAGEGTVRLVELLQKYNVPYGYNTFEDSDRYIIPLPNVTYHKYDLIPAFSRSLLEWRPIIQALIMPKLPTADLVIVDGPHGVSRADWYVKFKQYTRPGTIILVDDFHHYKEFGQELDKNFEYETIIEYQPGRNQPLINIGLEKINGLVGKCFKIVRVTNVKY